MTRVKKGWSGRGGATCRQYGRCWIGPGTGPRPGLSAAAPTARARSVAPGVSRRVQHSFSTPRRDIGPVAPVAGRRRSAARSWRQLFGGGGSAASMPGLPALTRWRGSFVTRASVRAGDWGACMRSRQWFVLAVLAALVLGQFRTVEQSATAQPVVARVLLPIAPRGAPSGVPTTGGTPTPGAGPASPDHVTDRDAHGNDRSDLNRRAGRPGDDPPERQRRRDRALPGRLLRGR